MLLSRFWYVVLAAVAGISMAAASLVRSTYERDRAHDSELLLRGDRRQIEEFLRTDARVRLDNLIPVAANPDLTRAMDAANRRTSETALRDLATRVSTQLTTLNNQERAEARADMLIAVDARGYVVGRAGDGATSGIGDYLGGVPIVARALDGYVRDDTWELTGRVFRMAARPVIYQGRYAGALLSAIEINNAFVRRISEALGGASVVFFTPTGWRAEQVGEADRRGRAAPTPATLASQINTLAANAQWRDRGYTDPINLQGGDASAIFGALIGSVGANGGGFAVGRPRPVLAADYLLHAPSDEVKRVRWPLIIGLMVGSVALGLLFIYLEHDRNDRQLREMLNKLAERKIDRLDPLALRGNARKTALAINEAFERAMKEELARAGAKPRRSVEDLDALLGPTPGASSTSQPMIDIPPPPPPPPGGGSGMIPNAPPPRPPGPPGPPAPPPGPPGSRPAIATPGGGPPPPPPGGSRPGIATPGGPAPMPPGTPAGGVTAPPATAAAPVAAPRPNAFADVDDEPTNVAQMGAAGLPGGPRPAAGVNPVVTGGGAGAGASGATDADEQAHWREVFEQFVATKRQCGEPTDTLVFEKFAATLVRHKEQLVQRTKCRAVRFQVYVKDGKATLKATPVK